MAIYLHDWAEGGEEEMLLDFGIEKDALEGAEILVASYTYEDYTGDAYVLFRRDGKLWEVYGSHCSCYGLSQQDYSGGAQTQWEPEEADISSLMHRLNKGLWGNEDGVADAVRNALVQYASDEEIKDAENAIKKSM